MAIVITPENEAAVGGGAPTVWTPADPFPADTGALSVLSIEKTGAAAHQARIVRTTGDFLADGFLAGDQAQLVGFAAGNNRLDEILTATASALTMRDQNDLMADEAAGGGDERVFSLPEFTVDNSGEDIEIWMRVNGAVPDAARVLIHAPPLVRDPDAPHFIHPWPDPSPLSEENDGRNVVLATQLKRFGVFRAKRFNEPDGTLRFHVAPAPPAAVDALLIAVEIGAIKRSLPI